MGANIFASRVHQKRSWVCVFVRLNVCARKNIPHIQSIKSIKCTAVWHSIDRVGVKLVPSVFLFLHLNDFSHIVVMFLFYFYPNRFSVTGPEHIVCAARVWIKFLLFASLWHLTQIPTHTHKNPIHVKHFFSLVFLVLPVRRAEYWFLCAPNQIHDKLLRKHTCS